jgi:geranylgeranyl pyrophosphate synthase
MRTLVTTQHDLERVRRVITDALQQTSLKDEVDRFGPSVEGGKMLRSRLVLEAGEGAGVSHDVLDRLGAAVELLHAASLLHDDIIDGGVERRHAAALWVSEGTKAAVLIGDLLLSIALGLVHDAGAARLPLLIRTLRDMCEAEAEQEFSIGQDHDSWEDCVHVARRKTGSLFGFSAACAAGDDMPLAEALERAGGDLGTAYQLADDLLDSCPDSAAIGKSLGTDAATGKLTAATLSAATGDDAVAAIEGLLGASTEALAEWPAVQQRWAAYVEHVIEPLVARYAELSQTQMV